MPAGQSAVHTVREALFLVDGLVLLPVDLYVPPGVGDITVEGDVVSLPGKANSAGVCRAGWGVGDGGCELPKAVRDDQNWRLALDGVLFEAEMGTVVPIARAGYWGESEIDLIEDLEVPRIGCE
jgi:hypothetical protein